MVSKAIRLVFQKYFLFVAVLILLAGRIQAADSISNQQVPSVMIHTTSDVSVSLSEIYQKKPVLLTFVYRHCSGACSAFIRSLKTIVESIGNVGESYQILVLSFDPNETWQDMLDFSKDLNLNSSSGWIFGTTTPKELKDLEDATGFWSKREAGTSQFDHPFELIAIRNGRIIRALTEGATVRSRLVEIIAELRGGFVSSYVLPGNSGLSCFHYDSDGRLRLDWGALLIALPAGIAIFFTFLIFVSNKPDNQ